MFCPNCGKVNEDDARYCIECGAPLAANAKSELSEHAPAYNYEPVTISSSGEKEPSGWPIVIGVLMLIGLLLSCAAYYFIAKFYRYYAIGTEVYLFNAIPLVLAMIGVLLFFTGTRRVPFVTAIPRILSILLSAYTFVMLAVSSQSSAIVGSQAINLITACLPVVLYAVCTAVKPRSKALAVIHLILSVLISVSAFFSADWRELFGRLGSVDSYILLSNFISCFAGIFYAAAYSIALFCVKSRKQA